MFVLMLDQWFKEMNIVEEYFSEVSTIVIGTWKHTQK